MTTTRILVVEDEPDMLEVCCDTLSKLSDVDVVAEDNSRRAEEKLSTELFDLLITDIRMPGINGVELLRTARKKNPGLIVLMLTAFPSVDTAVESMKLGAADYLTKPFQPEELRSTVRRFLEEKRQREENRLLSKQVEHDYRMAEMIGKSLPTQSIFDAIKRIAPTDIDVLILGETGTGKELVARNIHRESLRKDRRFVPVDCGAIPEDLQESQLFGHERGAFTGADERSMGLLELANKGTLFLDEVSHLSQKLQSKLLHVLQERKIRCVGGTKEIDVDVRLIAATSLDLDKEIKENRFRKDLYFRINVGRVDVPPLRERGEDIELMFSHFLNKYAVQINKAEIDVEPEVFEILNYYRWPGNVRELLNLVKRTLAMARGDQITVADLPDEIVVAAGVYSTRHEEGFFKKREQFVAYFERQYLADMLKAAGGDVSQAAGQAQVPRGTFYRLLKRNNLDPETFRTKIN